MQDEVTKHTRKIYRSVKKKNYSFRDKTIEISIEIFIIVFAVSLSIWLHSWHEHQHQQDEVKIFLINLKHDLNKDIINLNEGMALYMDIDHEYQKLLIITPSQYDSLKRVNSKVSFHVQAQGKKINDGNYESFKSSGKLGYLENENLKQLLLLYYEKSFPDIIAMDNYYNQFLFKTIELKIDQAGKTDKELYSDPKLKESIRYLIRIGNSNVKNYDEWGLAKARNILRLIDNELHN